MIFIHIEIDITWSYTIYISCLIYFYIFFANISTISLHLAYTFSICNDQQLSSSSFFAKNKRAGIQTIFFLKEGNRRGIFKDKWQKLKYTCDQNSRCVQLLIRIIWFSVLCCKYTSRVSSTLMYTKEGINFILAFFVISYPDCSPLKHDVVRSPLCGISSVS